MNGQAQTNWRRGLLIVVLVAAVWVLTTHAGNVGELQRTAAGGSLQWLLVAALFQIGYYACYTQTLRAAFRAVDIHRRFRDVLAVVLASIFVGTVTPAGAAAGTALIVDDSTRRGDSAGRSAAAVVLFELADFAGFGVVLLAGLAYLLLARRLQGFELVSAGVFFGIVAIFAGILVIGISRPAAISAAFRWLERIAAWVSARLRRESPAPWADLAAADFTDAAALVRDDPRAARGAWAVAVLGHVFDVMSLFAIGLAFGWHGLAALLAAYAVGVVVWLTAFVPQGVGLVEGAMALVLVSFGVPGATAAAIAIVFRGLTFWLPFALGFAALRLVKTFAPARDEGRVSAFAPRVAGVLVGVAGMINIVSAVTPSLADRVALLESIMPMQVLYGHLTAAVAGAGLLMLGRGLWHRKRAAWSIACALLAVSAVSHLLKGLDYEEAIVSAAVLVWLLAEHRAFLARSDRPSIRQASRVVGAAFVITLVYGTVGFWLLDRHFSVNFGLRAAMRQTVVMFTNFYDPGLQPITGFGRWFAGSIYVIGIITFGYALVMLLRSVLVRAPATAEEVERATAIVEEYGRSALARMALLPDKSYYFSEGGSVVAFAKAGEVGIALGDPIGPRDDAPAAIAGFQALCLRNGWRCAFYETLPDYLPAYRAAGFEAISVGEDAVVDLREFDIATGRKTLRHTLRRLEAEGHEVVMLPAPQSTRILRELRSVSDAWLAQVGGREMRFSLGWFDDEYIAGCDVMALRSPDGRIEAFANTIPEYCADEATIDLMRRRPTAPPGTMDMLFVRLLERARDDGRSRFNLGLSPLSGVGEQPDDPAVARLLQLVYEYGNRFYSFRGLHEYKAKFNPEWQPRYLVYGGASELPAAFAAVIRANAGGTEPLLEQLLRRGEG